MPNHSGIEPFHLAGLDWNVYQECLRIFLAANDIKDNRKVPTILNIIGGKTYQVLRNLLFPELPMSKTLDDIFATLTKHFCPRPSKVAERYRFSQRFQKENESFSEYISELRQMTQYCNFGTSLEERLCDQFVIGLRSAEIRQRLFQEMDVMLDQATLLASAMELSLKDATEINPSNANAQFVQKIAKKAQRKQFSTAATSSNCLHCGRTSHESDLCPLKEAICFHCKIKGHISKICQSKSSTRIKHRKPTHKMACSSLPLSDSDDQNDVDCACVAFDRISVVHKVTSKFDQPIMLKIKINNKILNMELDTGAAVTIIPEEIYETHFADSPLMSPGIVLRSFTGEKHSPRGKLLVTAEFEGKIADNLDLFVVNQVQCPLLGRNWINKFNILNLLCKQSPRVFPCHKLEQKSYKSHLEALLKKYSSLFRTSLGKIVGVKAHLSIKEDSQPRFFKARPVPYALRPALEAALVQLEKQGIISPVNNSDWAAPIVPIQKKDNTLRLCGDYKVGLNQVLNLDFYPLPKIEDMFAQLSGGVIFSKLDLAQAYQQMELDDESKKFVTINTLKGLFQVNRLPFGITSAPSIFQKTMEQILFGLKGVMCYLDGILVTGTGMEDHLVNLDALLNRLKESGIHLNKSKCEFFKEKVEYLGHYIDREGLHAAPSKISAVMEAPSPKNITDLRAFLGLINYYRKFLLNLSTVLAPLNKLLQKDHPWKWDHPVRTAFVQAKKLIASPVVLTHFDPQLPVVLACDASSFGLGAVLSHKFDDGSEHPIAYASRSLSSAEQGYSQIDKEALGIVFGVKRFHQYLFGRKFSLLTDHQPLTRIFGPKNAIPTLAASRLQRWAIILSSYSYDIQYRNTKDHGNADGLSRTPIPYSSQTRLHEEEIPADFDIISHIEQFPVDYKAISKATRRDIVLSEVLLNSSSGWPDKVKPELSPYFSRQEEISVQQGCLLWGIRVIIPSSLRSRLLEELHLQHTGTVKMKLLARSFFWWPGLDEDIGKITKACSECLAQSNCPEKAPLHPWNWPTKPWQRVHIDFAGPFQGTNFLVLVDAHSKWPEVFTMNTTTVDRTIDVLNSLISRFGLPEHIVSDNGPQFVSENFKFFCQSNGIRHTRSAPFHPATNGQAERFVQILKKNLKKTVKDWSLQQRINQLLFTYRSTPHCTTGETPAFLFLGRQIRTRLHLLRPSPETIVHVSQDNQMLRRDKSIGENFVIHQPVLARDYRNRDKWQPATIVSQTGPVSYKVQLSTGQIWRRHRDQLVPRSLSITGLKTPDATVITKNAESKSESSTTLRHNPPRVKKIPSRFSS